MGVDYRAKTIIGVPVNYRAFEETQTKSFEERGCKHDIAEGQKFCPECGEPAFVSVVTHSDLDLDSFISKLNLEHVEVCCGGGYDECEYYVGFGIETDSSRWGAEPKFTDLSNINIGYIKGQVQKALEPIGLWKENEFGLWTVLCVS